MTIDEAIKHCLEVAEQNETSAILFKNCKEVKTNMYEKLTAEKSENDCRECAADHRQLAEWLTELKEAKRLLKVAVNDIQDILHYANSISVCFHCVHRIDTCYGHPACKDRAKWEHLEEALKLIGEDGRTDE